MMNARGQEREQVEVGRRRRSVRRRFLNREAVRQAVDAMVEAGLLDKVLARSTPASCD